MRKIFQRLELHRGDNFQSLENAGRWISKDWKIPVFIASAALFGCLVAGCAARERKAEPAAKFDPAAFSGQKAMFEAAGLVAIGNRDSGTAGAEKAAMYLAKRLEAAGVTPEVDVFTNMTVRGPQVFRNVIGRLPGGNTNLIVVGSHYDTKPGIPDFVGANDSGSSSGALLELARVLAKRERRGPEIQLVFFDGEECVNSYTELDGFHGSRFHAQKLVEQGRRKNTKMILLDMIGDRDLTVTLAQNNDPKLATMFLRAAEDDGSRSHFALWPYECGDDHVAFLERGMPAVDIIDFDFGSAPGRNDFWHTAQDTMDKLSPESLQIIGRVTIRVLNALVAEDVARATAPRS